MTASNCFSRRSRLWIASIPVVVLGLMSGAGAARAANNPSPTPFAVPQNEVRIVATEFKFAAPSQRIVAGQPVTLILDNSQAESEHAIFFQGLGVRLFAQAGDTARKTVVFDKAGEFTFVCDLPGHREAGMIGKLVVRAGENGTSPELIGSIMK